MSQHKLLVLADMHVDAWSLNRQRHPITQILKKQGNLVNGYERPDMLVHAGDLAHRTPLGWDFAIPAIMSAFPGKTKAVFFPGNHDYFGGLFDDRPLAANCARAGVMFGQKRVSYLGATRLLTCTLWSDGLVLGRERLKYSLAHMQAQMPEYKDIRDMGGKKKITVEHTLAAHADHLAWLRVELGKKHDGPTMIITHHAPLREASGPLNSISGGFASDLSEMIEEFQPEAWVFGHTHFGISGVLGKTRVHNVGLGYRKPYTQENAGLLLKRGCVQVGDDIRFEMDSFSRFPIKKWKRTSKTQDTRDLDPSDW